MGSGGALKDVRGYGVCAAVDFLALILEGKWWRKGTNVLQLPSLQVNCGALGEIIRERCMISIPVMAVRQVEWWRRANVMVDGGK